jgi:hypothetical protein
MFGRTFVWHVIACERIAALFINLLYLRGQTFKRKHWIPGDSCGTTFRILAANRVVGNTENFGQRSGTLQTAQRRAMNDKIPTPAKPLSSHRSKCPYHLHPHHHNNLTSIHPNRRRDPAPPFSARPAQQPENCTASWARLLRYRS